MITYTEQDMEEMREESFKEGINMGIVYCVSGALIGLSVVALLCLACVLF